MPKPYTPVFVACGLDRGVFPSRTRTKRYRPENPHREFIATTHHTKNPMIKSPANATMGGRGCLLSVLYIGNLAKLIPEERVWEMLAEACLPPPQASTTSLAPTAQEPVKQVPVSVKLLNDKNRPGFNYAFADFGSFDTAHQALQTLAQALVDNIPLKVNWAYHLLSQDCTDDLFNLFVGDLSPDVDDDLLAKLFAAYPLLKLAHVMWDMQLGRLRGYGFVGFTSREDAETALVQMNGQWVSGRALRLNWAARSHDKSHQQQQQQQSHQQQQQHQGHGHQQHQVAVQLQTYPPQFYPQLFYPSTTGTNGRALHNDHQRTQNGFQNNHSQNGYHASSNGYQQDYHQQSYHGDTNTHRGNSHYQNHNNHHTPGYHNHTQNNGHATPQIRPLLYELVVRQLAQWQTTVYLGNVPHYTPPHEFIPLLQQFGYIVDFKFHPEKGCAFVKYDSHETAALAIVQLQGLVVHGWPLKCGWGRKR